MLSSFRIPESSFALTNLFKLNLHCTHCAIRPFRLGVANFQDEKNCQLYSRTFIIDGLLEFYLMRCVVRVPNVFLGWWKPGVYFEKELQLKRSLGAGHAAFSRRSGRHRIQTPEPNGSNESNDSISTSAAVVAEPSSSVAIREGVARAKSKS